MAFITGSVTNANPGPTLYALIETAALGIGWTLDDTVVIGSNTHKVLKSAAAGNTYGLDWYLDINYPTTGITGGMRFAPFEGYTAASDVGLRGPYQASNTTIDATTYSRFGASTSALETNWANTASFSALSATLSTSAFTYWISVTRDRIIVMTSLQATAIFYTGFFTPTALHTSHAGASLFPLVMARVSPNTGATTDTSSSTTTMSFTRVPKATSINWGGSGIVVGAASTVGWGLAGVVGTGVSEYTGLTQIIQLPVVMGTNQINTGAGYAHVGYLNGLAEGFTVGTAVRGDTITVGSDTWYATTVSSNLSLFMAGV